MMLYMLTALAGPPASGNLNCTTSPPPVTSILSSFAAASRPDVAAKYFKRALELDPLSAVINSAAGTNMHMLGRFEEAFAHNNKAIIDVAIPASYWGNAIMYWSVYGDVLKAATLMYQIRRLDPRSPQYTAFLSMAYLDLDDFETAATLAARAIELGPDDFLANYAALLVACYRHDHAEAVRIVRHVRKAHPVGDLYGNTASILHALAMCGIDDAVLGTRLEFYREAFPGLLTEDHPSVDRVNYRAAIDLAGILIERGEARRGTALLDSAAAFLDELPRLGWFGYGIVDAEILSLRGQTDKAIASIRTAVDDGWRLRWWTLTRNPNLAAIGNAPEIESIMEEIGRDMQGQLEKLRFQIVNDPLIQPDQGNELYRAGRP
ncbi:hypothetical protein BH24PSE2_BH24PSE2_23420 [soil metagenome]